MSAQTIQAIEDAVKAHFAATLNADDNPERKSAVVIDWVVGYTISNIVDVDGVSVVGFHNDYTSPDTNPNFQAHLAMWVADEISSILHGGDDD